MSVFRFFGDVISRTAQLRSRLGFAPLFMAAPAAVFGGPSVLGRHNKRVATKAPTPHEVGHPFDAIVLESPEQVMAHSHALQQLCAESCSDNPFYEPWVLMPALRHLANSSTFRLVLIYRSNILCAFLPFVEQRSYHSLPIRVWSAVQYDSCALTAPLLHRRWGQSALEYFFTCYMREHEDIGILAFPLLATEGYFHGALFQTAFVSRMLIAPDRRFTRALYRQPDGPFAELGPLSGRFRKHARRSREKLESIGRLTYLVLDSDNAESWLAEFLRLESSGWKGQSRSSIASSREHQTCFLEIARSGLSRGSFAGTALCLDGRMIAARTLLTSGDASYLYKIAYDEEFASFSPGTVLEFGMMLEPLPDGVKWTDAATMAGRNSYHRLWADSRTIEMVVIANRTTYGELCLSVVPLFRWLRRRFQKRNG